MLWILNAPSVPFPKFKFDAICETSSTVSLRFTGAYVILSSCLKNQSQITAARIRNFRNGSSRSETPRNTPVKAVEWFLPQMAKQVPSMKLQDFPTDAMQLVSAANIGAAISEVNLSRGAFLNHANSVSNTPCRLPDSTSNQHCLRQTAPIPSTRREDKYLRFSKAVSMALSSLNRRLKTLPQKLAYTCIVCLAAATQAYGLHADWALQRISLPAEQSR